MMNIIEKYIIKHKYKSFKTKKSFKDDRYWLALKNRKPEERVLFINSSSSSANPDKIGRLVDVATGNGMKVYISGDLEAFAQDKGITAVSEESDEYFRVLANASAIYTDTAMYKYFVKNDEQILLADISGCCGDVDGRIAASHMCISADWVISGDEEIAEIYDKLHMRNPVKNHKKNILIAANYKNNAVITDFLVRLLLKEADYDKFNIYLTVGQGVFQEHRDKFEGLNPAVKLLVRYGQYCHSGSTGRKMEFLKKNKFTVYEIDSIRSFIDKEAVDNEISRLFGKVKFDYVLNVGYESPSWRLLINKLNGKKLLVDYFNYAEAGDIAKARASFASGNDRVLFVNRKSMDNALKISRKAFVGRSEMMPYSINSQRVASDDEIDVAGSSYIIFNREYSSNGAVCNLKVTSVPSEKYNYAIMYPDDKYESKTREITRLAAEESLVVYDPFEICNTPEYRRCKENENVIYIKSQDVMESYIRYLGEEILAPEVPADSSTFEKLFN